MYSFVAIQYMELSRLSFGENFKAAVVYIGFALRVSYSFLASCQTV